MIMCYFFFFFQAEDGIRDTSVTGVQTCALPICSPLRQPGVDVKEGDYLLAVNGLPLDVTLEPWAAFQGLADKPVMITVNDKAGREGARDVLVQTLARESRLRHLAWIESNRRKVDEL